MATEIYEPLNLTEDFRVIILHPELRGKNIECGLKSFNLARRNFSYEALSYEWGSMKGPQTDILLAGSKFPVRENLWMALDCLRSESVRKILWIDAICI